MVVAAIGARLDAFFPAGCSVSSRSLGVSFERPGGCARTVGGSSARAGFPAGRPVPCFASVNSAAVVGVPVIKRPARRVVPGVVISCVMVMPIESPMTPAPSKTSIPSDSEADSPREVRPAKPDSGIWVPPRPRHYRTAVHHPRVICWDVNDVGAGRFNGDRRILLRYGLLRRALKIAGFFRSLAHHLHGVHHILFLVVVGVAERRRPREVLVHISEDGGKCSERLDARVPRLLVHSLTQSFALQIRMRLHPSVGL